MLVELVPFVMGLAGSAGGIITLVNYDRRLPDASGNVLPLFSAEEQSAIPDGACRLINLVETYRTPIRRTLRAEFFRSAKKPGHSAMRAASVYWVTRNRLLRNPRYWTEEASVERIADLATVLEHILHTAPGLEAASAGRAISRGMADLSRIVAKGHPATEALRSLREAMRMVLSAHRRQVPKVISSLNELSPKLGDFFLFVELEVPGLKIESTHINVSGGLARQVAYLIERTVGVQEQVSALRLFQRHRAGKTGELDDQFLKNRRLNNPNETKYDADLHSRFQNFLLGGVASP